MNSKTRINIEESIIVSEYALYSDRDPGDFLNAKKINEAKLDKTDYGYLITVSDEFKTLQFKVDKSFIIETQKLIYSISPQRANDHSRESAKNNMDLSIIGGRYTGCKAVLFLDQQHIKVYTNQISPNEDDRKKREIIIAFDEISQVSISSIKKDNSVDVGCWVGVIAWVLIGMYNASLASQNGGDPIIEFLASIVSGFIYGGIAFVIAKFIKQEKKTIRLDTDYSVIEIEYSDEVSDLMSESIKRRQPENAIPENEISEFNHGSGSSANLDEVSSQASVSQRVNSVSTHSPKFSYYDELIKLKELLDNDIITESEFQKLKTKIIGE